MFDVEHYWVNKGFCCCCFNPGTRDRKFINFIENVFSNSAYTNVFLRCLFLFEQSRNTR